MRLFGKMSAMEAKRNEQNSTGVSAADDVYELRLRKDRDGFDLVNDGFRNGPIWYSGPDAVRHAVLFARYRSRTRTHYATVRVLDVTGAVIQTYEPPDDLNDTNAIGGNHPLRDAHIRAADAVIRLYDAAGNVIEMHKHKGDFKEW
jgi:hypothetical protein